MQRTYFFWRFGFGSAPVAFDALAFGAFLGAAGFCGVAFDGFLTLGALPGLLALAGGFASSCCGGFVIADSSLGSRVLSRGSCLVRFAEL